MPEELKSIEMSRSPYRTIWKLAWPQILMMLAHFLIGFVDVWVAGRMDRTVMASLGMITQVLMFFLIVSIALANGATAAISQSVGAGLYKRVQRYVGLCVILALIFSLIFLVLNLPIKHLLLGVLSVPEELRHITDYFLEIYLLVLPSYYMLVITNAIFRAQKRVMFPLYSMLLVTTLNTIGDLGFGLGMFGLPELGYKGLAWATFMSITGGAALNLFMLARLKLLTFKTLPPMRWMRPAIKYLFKVAWPNGLLQIFWQSGYLALFAITAALPFGAIDALAGLTAGNRIEAILFMPSFAFNLTAGILVGHYLGARQPQEAKRFGYKVMLIGLGAITVMGGTLWLFVEDVVAIINSDPIIVTETISYLSYNIAAMPFIVIVMVLAGALNGAGATMYNMIIMGAGTWFVRLPLAWFLGHVVMMDAEGIWAAMFISQIIQAAAMLFVFQFKDWQRFSMIRNKRPSESKEPVHASSLRAPHH